jgi:hypothetical protein
MYIPESRVELSENRKFAQLARNGDILGRHTIYIFADEW